MYRPEAQRDLLRTLNSADEPSLIPRGLGRSYGDAALNRDAGVVSLVRLDRLLDLDLAQAELECEAGVSLGRILSTVMPHGFFLPVVPGTRHVTVGGAIACDIHGKNHHRDGTFSRFVTRLTVLTPAGELVRCSPDEYRDLFWATVGGMGLTGIIVTARLRLMPIETGLMMVDYRRAPDLEAVLRALEETDLEYRYSVAWVDCLARGAALGRSVLMLGDHATRDQASDTGLREALRSPRLRVPFDAPSLLLSRAGVKVFNALYYRVHPSRTGAVVPADRFFFPLDGIGDWNRLYGRRGFVQYQAVVPSSNGGRAVRSLLEQVSASGWSSFLGVLKRMGPGGEGLLSFPADGYTLALDIPRRRGLGKLLAELDRIVLDAGGRIYLAKDASLTAGALRQMYPGLERFRSVKEALDPGGRLSSSQSRRLGITDAHAPSSPGAGASR